MLHTKNIIYILIVSALIGLPAFWCFLIGRDEDDNKDER